MPPQPPYQQPPYPQQPYAGQPGMPPGAPPPKKSSALKWILIGAGILVFCVIALVGTLFYVGYSAIKRAGVDPELFKSNPGLAAAKLAATLNPEWDVLSTNDSSGTITVRDKKTGEVSTLKFDAEKNTFVVINQDGKQVEFKASGDEKSGSLEINAPDGSVKFGAAAGNSAPAWVPVYPGSTPQGTISSQTPEGNMNTFTFTTKDSANQVLTYYENQMKSRGFNITLNAKTGQGGMITSEDGPQKRALMVTVGTADDGTTASVTATEKK